MIINLFIAFSIFVAKIIEVSLSSIKLIFMMKHQKVLSAMIAFVECLIWAMVISGIVATLKDNIFWVIAYCGGYACGYYLGSLIDEKLAMGTSFVQFIVPKKDELAVINKLKEFNCGITMIDGKGTQSDVTIIITFLPKKSSNKIIDEISKLSDSSIFTTISDVNKTFGGSGLMK